MDDPEGVLRQLTMYAVAYNLVRVAMCEAAGRQGCVGGPDQLRGCMTLAAWSQVGRGDAWICSANPCGVRAGRTRAKKRRPKPYRLMQMKPRPELWSSLGRRTRQLTLQY